MAVDLKHPFSEGRTAVKAIEHVYIEANGAALHIARTGQGRPLLLLHGWPEFWFTWQPVMERLAEQFTLIAPDLRGFGTSDKPSGPFGPEDQAADLAALIQTLELGPVGVVSHDIGASIAQALARHAPEMISGLFFFTFMYPGIGSRYTAPDHLNAVWHTWFNQTDLAPKLVGSSPEAVRLFITHFLKGWAHRKDVFDEETLDIFVANYLLPGNLAGGFAYYRAVAERRNRGESDEPAPITLPTCIRWAERDPTLPLVYADRLSSFFSDLDFAPFPDAGHFPHREHPDRAAAAINTFFERLAHREKA